MKLSSALRTALLFAGAACSESTAPPHIEEPIVVQKESAASVIAAEIAPPDFEDVMGRILPAVPDQAAAREIRSQIGLIVAAMESNDEIGARKALSKTRILLSTSQIHPASVGAIMLALNQSQSFIDEGEAVPPSSR